MALHTLRTDGQTIDIQKYLADAYTTDVNGDIALRTTASITGDVNIDNNSVNTGGLIGKATGTNGDFTTAYSTGTSITLSSLPTGVSAIKADDVISVMQISSTGNVTKTYTRDDAIMTATGTDPTTLTITGATFSNTDTFVVYTNIERINDKTNITQLNGNTINTNGGNKDVGTQTVAIADDDNVSTKLTSIDNKDFATETTLGDIKTNQTDGSQKIQIVDSSGNEIASENDADGEAHLGTSIIQDIITSTNNSTTTNLNSGATFTGTADETFGINGIQVFHAADQDCTIYIDQSVDNTFANSNETITDSFSCLANSPCSRVFTSVSPYYRLRVTNDGDIATTSLKSYTGMTPMINTLPRALTEDERVKVENTMVGQQNTDRHVWVTNSNAMNTVETVRLVGTNFDGTTKDTNFWTQTVTGSGSVTQSGGEIELGTGVTANSTVQYNSVRRARFVVSSPLQWQSITKFVTAGTTNNVRRIGAYDDTDGFFFELDGATFSIGYRKSSSDTTVSSGSFNGNYGPSYTLDTAYHKFAIEWGPKGVFFYIDGILLHKDSAGHRSNFLSLPIRFENNNSNGLTTDVVLDVLASAIVRYGSLITNPTSHFESGQIAAQVLKYGPGAVRGLVISNIDNNANVILYDNTAASGTVIWNSGQMPSNATPFDIDMHGLPFSTGLTLAITTADCDTLVVYE